MRKKRWQWVVIGLGVVAGGVFLAAQTTQVGRGLLRGESFFDGRPTSYWREVLRVCGQTGAIDDKTVESLRKPTAIPVLIECFEDADHKVRWPAVNLLGRFTGRTLGFNQRVLPTLRKALHDEHVEVRLQAVLVAEQMGPNAQMIAPDLERLLNDPEFQVRNNAELALWEVAPAMARAAGGWKPFSSKKWGFFAEFPEPPIEKESTAERWESNVSIHSFHSASGESRVAQYGVAVSDYDPAVLKSIGQQERYDSARDWIAATPGCKLVRDEPVEQNQLLGREYEFEFRGTHSLRTSLFWREHRLYQVVVSLSREFSSDKAAEHFLNSFKLDSGN